MSALRTRLETAAKGHKAAYGDSAPNLFDEALAEIKRLDEIERLIKSLIVSRMPLAPDHRNDVRAFVDERAKTGRELLAAVTPGLVSK